MSRILLSSLLAIALLFLGSVAILYRFGGGSRRPSPQATSSAPAPAVTGAETSGSASPAAERAPQRRAPEAAPVRVAATQEVMPPTRRHGLVSFRRELKTGLADLERRIASCATKDEDLQRRGSPAREAVSFLLEVETVAGGLRIAGARPDSTGTASDAEVACARSFLLHHVIPAPSAEPGRRWQLRFSPRPGT